MRERYLIMRLTRSMLSLKSFENFVFVEKTKTSHFFHGVSIETVDAEIACFCEKFDEMFLFLV
jgi:hypothetical protein